MKFADALVKKFGLAEDCGGCTAIWADPLKEWIENQPDGKWHMKGDNK